MRRALRVARRGWGWTAPNPLVGAVVVRDGQVVGEVTSGTRGPSIGQNVAIAYVPSEHAKIGTKVQIDIRGKIAEAVVSKTPFYQRPY